MRKGPFEIVQYLILEDVRICAKEHYISVHESVPMCVCLQP